MQKAVASEMLQTALGLNTLYYRGALEEKLRERKYEYRSLLFERSNRKYIKIIYYADDLHEKVYVTDFFPSEMDDNQLPGRNE